MVYTTELYHYGVKGMRWGHRKAQAERTAYKQAKRDFRDAVKNQRRNSGLGIGINGITKAEKAQRNVNNARVSMINAKAKYNAAKSKNSEKAEFNTYRKAMQKTGLVGSYADQKSGGQSKKLYNSIKAQKGKEYADRVQKRVQNVAYAKLATAAAVTIGSSIVSAYLESRS